MKDGNISASQSACRPPLHDGNSDEVRRRMECGDLALYLMLALQRALNASQQITGMWSGVNPVKEESQRQEAPGTTSALVPLSHSMNFDPVITWQRTGSLPVWRHTGTLSPHLCAGKSYKVATVRSSLLLQWTNLRSNGRTSCQPPVETYTST